MLICDNKDVIAEFEKAALKTSTNTVFYRISEGLGMDVLPDAAPFPSTVLFKDYDERKVIYREGLAKSALKKYLKDSMIPNMARLEAKYLDMFLKSSTNRKGFVLFRNESQGAIADKEFAKFRAEVPDKEFLFLYSSFSEVSAATLQEQFMVEPKEFPVIVLFYADNMGVRRYIYRNEISKEGMLKFYHSWREGKLQPVVKGQEVPATNPGPVFKAVSKTFDKEVLEPAMDVMVKFYAPWCQHCQKLEPIYKEVAAMYPSVKFVEIDASANEVEGHLIESFPVVQLFLKDEKATPYNVPSNSKEDLVKFIKSHCKGIESDKMKVDL